MADIIITQDPTKPGVLKGNGPTLTAAGDLPLTALSVTGAVNGQAVVLTAGDWAPGNVASSDTASNLGAGSQVFKSKVATDFQFRSLIAGTGLLYTTNANDITLSLNLGTSGAIAILTDQKAQNTDGGTFTTGAWRTRDINTELADDSGIVTIAANQMTLIAGIYDVFAITTANGVNHWTSRLQNITAGTTAIIGSSQFTNSSPSINTYSVIIGQITLLVSSVLEIQAQCETTQATTGFGDASNFQAETYTQIYFRKH